MITKSKVGVYGRAPVIATQPSTCAYQTLTRYLVLLVHVKGPKQLIQEVRVELRLSELVVRLFVVVCDSKATVRESRVELGENVLLQPTTPEKPHKLRSRGCLSARQSNHSGKERLMTER